MKHCCYRFIVSGRVQGGFFRASTREQAIRLQLSGWVRNLMNGDVELIARGDIENIEQLQAWLWQGPKFARVTEVKSERLSETSYNDLNGFEVRSDG